MAQVVIVAIVALWFGIPVGIYLYLQSVGETRKRQLTGSSQFVLLHGRTSKHAAAPSEIVQWYLDSEISPTDPVWDPRAQSWLTAGDLPELRLPIQERIAAYQFQGKMSARSSALVEVSTGLTGLLVQLFLGIVAIGVALFVVVKIIKWMWYF